MTFDDQLKRAFDTLTDRLRDEIDRQVLAAVDELSASARRQAEHAKLQREEAVAAAIAAATPPPAPEPVPVLVVDAEAEQRLLDAARAMDDAHALTGVLDALVAVCAHGDAGAGVWLLRGGALHHWRSTRIANPDDEIALEAQRAIADAARTGASAWDDGLAVPLALGGQVVAVLYATSPRLPGPSAHAIELLSRHAASRLETITAFKTARALADAAESSSGKTAGGAQAAAANAANAEEHVSAQRYARLLVSEIRLYHEQAVIEGRRDRDLATRLGGEIARARVMYEQRVPPHIRQHADHFHDELVRTLADGDPTLLELRT